jgi:hypothetical protein
MTKSDKSRMDKISHLPCMACVQEGCSQPNPTEVHHIVDKGYRRLSGGHQATIALCGWHHRGEPIMGDTMLHMRAYYGPSMFHHGKEFTKLYGTQRQLLARVNEVINERTV